MKRTALYLIHLSTQAIAGVIGAVCIFAFAACRPPAQQPGPLPSPVPFITPAPQLTPSGTAIPMPEATIALITPSPTPSISWMNDGIRAQRKAWAEVHANDKGVPSYVVPPPPELIPITIDGEKYELGRREDGVVVWQILKD